MGLVTNFVPLLIASGVVLSLATVAYRVFFHPLAKYPGPLLAKITDWWGVWHAWQGDLAHIIEQQHRQHGEFVRFGPNRISSNTIEALEAVYGFKANTKKSDWYRTFALNLNQPSTHTVIDKTQHGRKRRLVSQGLSTKSTRELEPHIIESVDVLTKQLRPVSSKTDSEGWGEAKDMSAWSCYLTSDIMGAMVFSQRFGLMESPENRWLKEAVPIASRGKYAGGFMPWVITSGFDAYLMPSLTAMRRRMGAFSGRQLQNRFARQEDEELNDLFHFILSAKDPETGESFGPQELGSEANLLVAAGGDTTSTAISSAFFFLTKDGNEAALEKLKSEIRGTFESLEQIKPGPLLNSCTYLRACLDESMRIAPPVASPLMREALVGGVTIKGHTFRQGTDIAVPSFAIHRNPEYYPEPLAYRPERWIHNGGDDVKDNVALERAQHAFSPFSIGPRSCVGRAMGYLEMTVTLARLLWAMDVRRVPGNRTGEDHDGTYKMLDGFVAEKHGPHVQFRRRS